MSNNLYNMALQLSVQEMFSSSWFSNALMNKVWTEMMRSSLNGLVRNTGGADLLGAALGGQLRGDAAMLGQASKNVSEAQSMMSMASKAVGSIASLIGEARDVAEQYIATPSTALLEQYQAISDNIDSIIKNTTYNGIALLDGSDWGNDRISATGSVHIQAGNSGFPLTFHDMNAEFANIAGKYNNPATVLADLDGLQNSAQTLANLYSGRAGSLKSQTASLQSQAKILEEAAAQRVKTPAPVSTENVLLNLILRDTGGLFSGKG